VLDRGMRVQRRAVLGALAAGLLLVTLAGSAQAASGPYVSMGDSYTAAPLVPTPTGNPIGCGRSTNNYPSDVARALAPSSFTDVSCSAATTIDMYVPQSVPFGGTNPPQLNAVSTGDSLVTIGIGGNDAGLITVVETCAEIDAFHPTGSACKSHYEASGSDPNVAAIRATGTRVATVLRSTRRRAPSARVLIVGYPDGLPVNGSNCWPRVPLSSGDIAYINALEQQLNLVIARQAASNGATYVDTFTSSVGHDACQPPGVEIGRAHV